MNDKSQRMQCMEIIGGNLATDTSYQAPGLEIYVQSSPYKDSETGGGDVYYLTSCASGRITRILLADVSGHGEAASGIAVSLRDSMRKNVNTISQSRFVESMNRKFNETATDGNFATAVVATYFEPKKTLTLGLAGHPNPMIYRVAKQKWDYLNEEAVAEDVMGNLPLGVVSKSAYPSRRITVEMGDMFLLYSDAFIESMKDDSNYLGIAGVVDLLNSVSDQRPAQVIPQLRKNILGMSGGNLKDDDATLIVGQFTGSKPSIKDTLAAPFRLLTNTRDKTEMSSS